MLKLTGEYGKFKKIKFNTDKTHLDCKCTHKRYKTVQFNGETLTKIRNIK